MLYLLTPTDGRPEAFGLLEEWMAAQDFSDPFRWIVATSDYSVYNFRMQQMILHRTNRSPKGTHPLAANLGIAFDSIASSLGEDDQILIIEDDDYYAPHYLSMMVEALERTPLVGAIHAKYYNIQTNRFRMMANTRHASLAQTGFRKPVLDAARTACSKGSKFVDKSLWALWPGDRYLFEDARTSHVSIKGMPGTMGAGIGHKDGFGNLDAGLQVFREWQIPDVYLKFGRPAPPILSTPGLVSEPFGGLLLNSPYVAPTQTGDVPLKYQGRIVRKPWDYPITAVIPHLMTPEPLEWSVRTILAQTVPTYVLIVDTGSDSATVERLERLRSENVEIHYIKSHSWRQSSEPVSAAMDLAFSMIKSQYVYCTHADCFLRRKDYLEWMLTKCSEQNPVVGYQMSPRDWVTDQWKWMVSHTNTLMHMPTIFKHGVSWSMERYRATFPEHKTAGNGWPDTETGFNWFLKMAGITPELIGVECNWCRDTDHNRDHVRSFCLGKIYDTPNARHRVMRDRWMEAAIIAARQRVAEWTGVKPEVPVSSVPSTVVEEEIAIAIKPGIFTKAANYTRAFARHVAAGLPESAPPQIAAERLAICESCPQLDASRECRVCGCPVDDKVTWVTESCPMPDPKWRAIEEPRD